MKALLPLLLVGQIALSANAAEPADQPQPPASITLRIVYDNYVFDEKFEADWGFACVITGPEKTILLDTGSKGDLLLANLKKMSVRPEDIDAVVISHNHGDHTGGLLPFLQQNPKVFVFLPAKSPKDFMENVQQLASETTVVAKPAKICDGAVILGPIGDQIIEQAAVIDTPKVS